MHGDGFRTKMLFDLFSTVEARSMDAKIQRISICVRGYGPVSLERLHQLTFLQLVKIIIKVLFLPVTPVTDSARMKIQCT